MDNDYADLQALIAAIGGTASAKKKPKLAPGGLAPARPAPAKVQAKDGISDSAFVQQIIQAAQQMSGGGQMGGPQMGGMSMTPMTTPNQPPMGPQQPQQAGGGIGSILGALGGMG